MNGIQLLGSRVNFVLINFYILTIEKIWYLSAIEIIDTQVARRGRQYHRNPPPYKNRPTKKNRIYKIKTPPPPKPHHTTPPPPPPPPPSPTQPNPTPTLPTPNTQPNPKRKRFSI